MAGAACAGFAGREPRAWRAGAGGRGGESGADAGAARVSFAHGFGGKLSSFEARYSLRPFPAGRRPDRATVFFMVGRRIGFGGGKGRHIEGFWHAEALAFDGAAGCAARRCHR